MCKIFDHDVIYYAILCDGSFLLTTPNALTPPPPHTHTHTIMDMRNNKRRNVLTHARVKFSQSETSSLLRGGS